MRTGYSLLWPKLILAQNVCLPHTQAVPMNGLGTRLEVCKIKARSLLCHDDLPIKYYIQIRNGPNGISWNVTLYWLDPPPTPQVVTLDHASIAE